MSHIVSIQTKIQDATAVAAILTVLSFAAYVWLFRAVFVRGESRTGKTYSLQLILHVTAAMRDVLVVHVDFSQAATGDSAAALVTSKSGATGNAAA